MKGAAVAWTLPVHETDAIPLYLVLANGAEASAFFLAPLVKGVRRWDRSSCLLQRHYRFGYHRKLRKWLASDRPQPDARGREGVPSRRAVPEDKPELAGTGRVEVSLDSTDVGRAVTLREEDLPALYHAANTNSIEAQRRYLRNTMLVLLMMVIAAVAGETTGWKMKNIVDVGGLFAAVAFGIGIVLSLSLAMDRPERIWYKGRAAAESARTLAWRYSVGGEPFRVGQDPDEVDAAFVARLREILMEMVGTGTGLPSGQTQQITPRMRELRGRPLEARKEAYRIGRIEDQRDWYLREGRWHKVRADLWNLGLISAEVFGLTLGIMRAVGVYKWWDLLGLAATAVAAGTSWLQTRQHSNLSQAYSVASQELSAIHELITTKKTEEAWARFVTDAEGAISREHTLWRASRTAR
jgi:SMODS and SLOG-associating 2TM effector domain 3/SMODS and SLOG-associating 2TM effector domain 1